MANKDFQQKDGEEFLDWKFRLIVGKIEKTLDIDWSEMVEVLGLECHPDHLRKTAYGAYEAYQHLKDKTNPEFSLGKYEIVLERKKLETDKLELTRLLRESGRKEMLFEQVKSAIQTVKVPEFYPLIEKPKGDKHGLLSFGDVHLGKKFKSINNEYNEEIAFDRMNKLLAETIRIGKREGLTHINVQNLADSIEGMTLRISQLQSLQSGMVDQTIMFSKMMVNWLNELSRHFEVIYHHVNSANHSEIRAFGTSRGEMPAEDMEKIIVNYIRDALKFNERVSVPEYKNDYVRLDLGGHLIYSLHGHQIKSYKNVIKDLTMRHNEFIDSVYLGHFHHEDGKTVGESPAGNKRVIGIPSVMGSDNFADKIMEGAKAGARFDVYESGKNTVIHPIELN